MTNKKQRQLTSFNKLAKSLLKNLPSEHFSSGIETELLFDQQKRLLFDTIALTKIEIAKILRESLKDTEKRIDIKTLGIIQKILATSQNSLQDLNALAMYEEEISNMSPQETRIKMIELLQTYEFLDEDMNANVPSEEEFELIWQKNKEAEDNLKAKKNEKIKKYQEEIVEVIEVQTNDDE